MKMPLFIISKAPKECLPQTHGWLLYRRRSDSDKFLSKLQPGDDFLIKYPTSNFLSKVQFLSKFKFENSKQVSVLESHIFQDLAVSGHTLPKDVFLQKNSVQYQHIVCLLNEIKSGFYDNSYQEIFVYLIAFKILKKDVLFTTADRSRNSIKSAELIINTLEE